MDCPEPIMIITPDLKTKKSRKFNSKDEQGKEYEIEIGVTNESIIFKSEINNGIITKKYSNIYSFDTLKKNNIFTFQENIEEIYDQIEVYFEDEPVSSTINENSIIIKILTKIKKYPEIIFELKKEVIDINKIINILIDKINILESENKNLKTEISKIYSCINDQKELEKKINNLELENKNLRTEISNINSYINEQKEIKRKKKLNFNDSLIVKEDEINMICKWINPYNKIKAELLYRVSRDGDDPSIFHKYCDNKGPTIMFAKINNGYRFGGYSGISWTNKDQCVKDKDAFLFSLNNKIKIINNNTNETVYHGKACGPTFASYSRNELQIQSYKCLTGKKNLIHDLGKVYTFKIKDLIGVEAKGKYYFDVEDYEVYSIKNQ